MDLMFSTLSNPVTSNYMNADWPALMRWYLMSAELEKKIFALYFALKTFVVRSNH